MLMRASHADREHAIETLKDAFVAGRLTKDELDALAGRALAARTYAELAALTAEIRPAPASPAPATSARAASTPAASAAAPAVSGPNHHLIAARRRTLVRAAAGSGGSLALAGAALGASFILDPGPTGAERPWAGLMLQLALCAAMAGVCILWSGVASAVQQRLPSGMSARRH
jgi:hypothetical protein